MIRAKAETPAAANWVHLTGLYSQRREAVFLTTRLDLPTQSIADLYRGCWQIGVFFKYIKQYLPIESFFATLNLVPHHVRENSSKSTVGAHIIPHIKSLYLANN